MRANARQSVLGLLTALAGCLSACRDSLAPGRDAASLRADEAASGKADSLVISEAPVVQRFSISAVVSGSLRPGAPAAVSASIVANVPTQSADVSIVFPELDGTQAITRRAQAKRVGTALPSAYYAAHTFPSAQPSQINLSFSIGRAGYYRAVVSVVQRSNEASVKDGRWVTTAATTEVWFTIDETGGRVTGLFDAGTIPDSADFEPGERSYLVGLAAKRAMELRASRAADSELARAGARVLGRAKLNAPSGISHRVSRERTARQLVYHNPDANQLQPVAGAIVYWYISDTFGNTTDSYYGETDSNGAYPGPCVPYPALEYASVSYALENGDVRVVGGSGSWIEGNCDLGMLSNEIESERAWLFSRNRQFIPFSRGLLNAARPLIEVVYDLNEPLARYHSGPDRVVTGPNAIFFDYGRFVVAHEYGHAIQEKALGGLASTNQCPDLHQIFGYYNLSCAYQEGFADFVGVASENLWNVAPYYARIVDYTNNTYYTPGTDGSIQEAAVAAMMYDLADAPGGDGGASEPWDITSGERVAATMRDCRVRYSAFTVKVRGADDFIYCAERTINSAVRSTYFQTRPSAQRATSITANATPSANWPATGVRSVWRKNLYGLN